MHIKKLRADAQYAKERRRWEKLQKAKRSQ